MRDSMGKADIRDRSGWNAAQKASGSGLRRYRPIRAKQDRLWAIPSKRPRNRLRHRISDLTDWGILPPSVRNKTSSRASERLLWRIPIFRFQLFVTDTGVHAVSVDFSASAFSNPFETFSTTLLGNLILKLFVLFSTNSLFSGSKSK